MLAKLDAGAFDGRTMLADGVAFDHAAGPTPEAGSIARPAPDREID